MSLSLLMWPALVVGWLTIGTLIGMAKWAVFYNDSTEVPWYTRTLRRLMFPFSSLDWAGRKTSKSDGPAPPVSDIDESLYYCIMAVIWPFTLLFCVPGLIAVPIIGVTLSMGWLIRTVVNAISTLWRARNNKGQSRVAIKQLELLKDVELARQQKSLLQQVQKLGEQAGKLELCELRSKSDTDWLKDAENAQFARMSQVTHQRIGQLLGLKRTELDNATAALKKVESTRSLLYRIIKLIETNAYLDSIDPATNDTAQQLLRQAYESMEACRTAIAKAQSCSISTQARDFNVNLDSLAEQVDAGWTADEKRVDDNTQLLMRLAEPPREVDETRPNTALLRH